MKDNQERVRLFASCVEAETHALNALKRLAESMRSIVQNAYEDVVEEGDVSDAIIGWREDVAMRAEEWNEALNVLRASHREISNFVHGKS